MKVIPLTKNEVTFVDDEDYEKLKHLKCYVHIDSRTGQKYAKAWIDNKNTALHSIILSVALVDHIDGNGLNNQRSNLRPATKQQNSFNARKCRKKRHSKYKGVSINNSGGKKWKAYICKDYKLIHLGYFDTEDQAALVYNEAAKQLFGEFAHLNDVSKPKEVPPPDLSTFIKE